MADLFSVRAPLMIRSPHGGEKVIAELFPHPEGILFFEIFWDQMPGQQGVHLIKGEISGEGPWKVGDYVINILGCQGTHTDLATDFSEWQLYRQMSTDYPDTGELAQMAAEFQSVENT